MTQDPSPLGACGRTRLDWLSHLSRIGSDHGFFNRIGASHYALFVEESDTLLVSFDTATRVFESAPDGLPLGFDAVQRRDWSLLSILCRDAGGFRNAELEAFFCELSAAGFFKSYQKVLFVGFGGAAGHAAAVYSQLSPDADVLLAAPIASYDPERSGFDASLRSRRFSHLGRFDDAPAALTKARSAVVLYDPFDTPSGAHAAQFNGAPVLRIPVRFAGAQLPNMLRNGDLTVPLLRALDNGRLTRARAAELVRPVRRGSSDYLWQLCGRAMSAGHFERAAIVASYGADITGEPRFIERAQSLGVHDVWDFEPAS